MSTYVVSDVHGCLSRLEALLDRVSPCADDAVWVLGDLCDRGPESAEALVWAVEGAPGNVRFLLGNHDQYARDVFALPPGMWWGECDHGWWINGGTETLACLEELRDEEWLSGRLGPWLAGLRPYAHVTDARGRGWMLVHAGFDPREFAEGVVEGPDVWWESPSVDVGHGFGTQSEGVMTWVRWGWLDYVGTCPLPVVYGHTPVPYLRGHADGTWDHGPLRDVPSDDRVWRCDDRVDVDCGCVYGGRLAMLRLEDGEEFYVDGV